MNNPYIPDRERTPEIVEAAKIETDLPIQNSDPFADKTPVDPDLIVETPMGGTVASAAPINAPPAEEIPMFETPHQEIPMGGTVAPVGPMFETPHEEIPMGGTVAPIDPMYETIPPVTPAVGSLATEPGVRETFPYLPYMDPLDQKLNQDVPVNTVAEPSEPSVAATVYADESEHLLTTMNEDLGKLTD